MVGAGSAVAHLVSYCRQRVDAWVKEFEPASLDDLLKTVAAKVGLLVEYVETVDELMHVVASYVQSGEGGFVRVPRELDDRTFALVLRLRHPRNGSTHVAVVDCRGPKGARRWFSIWHEIAHLLVQPQLVFDFRRTRIDEKDSVEQAMDAIAGEFAFYDSLCRFELPNGGQPTLAGLEQHRRQTAPQASIQSAYATTVARLQTPALLVVAERALKAEERRALRSGSLFPDEFPIPKLRAVSVMGSKSAPGAGLFIPPNIRVPERSVIARVYDGTFAEEHVPCEENLSWWESRGKNLAETRVSIEAAKFGARVLALVLPSSPPRPQALEPVP
jgi:hypothetical protein